MGLVSVTVLLTFLSISQLRRGWPHQMYLGYVLFLFLWMVSSHDHDHWIKNNLLITKSTISRSHC